jgi:hypothetical protein
MNILQTSSSELTALLFRGHPPDLTMLLSHGGQANAAMSLVLGSRLSDIFMFSQHSET